MSDTDSKSGAPAPKHVCGLSGFGRGDYGHFDRCPACEAPATYRCNLCGVDHPIIRGRVEHTIFAAGPGDEGFRYAGSATWQQIEDAIERFAQARHDATRIDGEICPTDRKASLELIASNNALRDLIVRLFDGYRAIGQLYIGACESGSGHARIAELEARLRDRSARGINQASTPAGEETPASCTDIESAIRVAVKAHCGLRDKQGQPAILHAMRVMLAGETEDERIVGALHDVIEDSEWTPDALRGEGLSSEVISAVEAISRRDGEAYTNYIERVALNPLAARVKVFDLRGNIARAGGISTAERSRLLPRYERALARLASDSLPSPSPEDGTPTLNQGLTVRSGGFDTTADTGATGTPCLAPEVTRLRTVAGEGGMRSLTPEEERDFQSAVAPFYKAIPVGDGLPGVGEEPDIEGDIWAFARQCMHLGADLQCERIPALGYDTWSALLDARAHDAALKSPAARRVATLGLRAEAAAWWLVGRDVSSTRGAWEFQGIYTDKAVAVALCYDATWFVAPVRLNEPVPEATTEWPGAFRPVQ